MSAQFCIYCGNGLQEDDAFCQSCGREVLQAQPPITEASQVAIQEEPVLQEPVEQMPEPAPQYTQQPPPAQTPPRPQYMPAGAPAQPYIPRPIYKQTPEALSLGATLGMLLVAIVPILGWVLLFVWGFDSSTAPNKKTVARALLIEKAIITVLFFLWFVMFLLTALYRY